MKAFRILAALAGLGLVVVLARHITSAPVAEAGWTQEGVAATQYEDPPVHPDPYPFTDSASCKPCHEEVYAEWEDSHHRIAYTNPEVQKLSKGFELRDCLPCHLPRPVIESGLGVRVLEREDRHAEGVDCLTCHLHPKSRVVLGQVPGASDAPCRPVRHPAITDQGMCAPCHNQHKVHDDWSQTRFAVEGEGFSSCNDCHMPIVERANGRQGRHHGFPAAHDEDMLRSAASFEATRDGEGRLLAKVMNDGTGHHFPADERHRAVDLELTLLLADGREVTVQVDRYRNPYRDEPAPPNPLRHPGDTANWTVDAPNYGAVQVDAERIPAAFNPKREHRYEDRSTQIPAGEARSYVVRLPGAARRATFRLWFRTWPSQPNSEAVLLHERILDL